MLPQLRNRLKPEPRPRVHRPAHHSARVWRLALKVAAESLIGVLVLLIAAVFVLDRADMRFPLVAEYMAERLSATLGPNRLQIGSVSFAFARDDRFAGVTIYEVQLLDAQGAILLAVPKVEVKFTLLDLLRGDIRPRNVVFSQVEALLTRDRAGIVRLALGQGAQPVAAPAGQAGGNLTGIVEGTEFLSAVPELSRLAEVSIRDARVRYFDELAGRNWLVRGAELVLQNRPGGYWASLEGHLDQNGGAGTELNVTAAYEREAGTSSIRMQFSNAAPRDLADEFAALGWMRLLDAPVSGQLRLDITAENALATLAGEIEIGAGNIVQKDAEPVPFRAASVAFDYDPARTLFRVSALRLDSAAMALEGDGIVDVEFAGPTEIRALIGQLDLRDIVVDPPGVFAVPIRLADGRAALKVSLEEFAVTIGELSGFDAERRVAVSGTVRPEGGKWTYAIDLAAAGFDRAGLLEFWPLDAAPKARIWVSENIREGRIASIAGGIRSTTMRPKFMLQFGFAGVRSRFLKFMPDGEQVSGYGTLNEKSFEINIVEGFVNVSDKGRVSAAGTRVEFPDYKTRPAPTLVALVAQGEFPAVFDLIERAPLSLLSKAGLDPQGISGAALVRANLSFPATKGLTVAEVTAEAVAELSGVATGTLLPGRQLAAELLLFSAKDGAMSLAGTARLDDLPVRFEWTRAYGPGSEPGSHLQGRLPLNAETLAGLGLHLPTGSVKGEAQGIIEVDLQAGAAPRFTLTADIGPLGLSVASLGWTKAAGREGTAIVLGRLTTPPSIEAVSIEAPGLSASGSVDLADGRIRGARFDRLQLNNWLDSPVSYNNGMVRISGGNIDLRRQALGGRSGNGGRVELENTRIAVTDTIALAAASGSLVTAGTIEGRIVGRVNGGAAVEAALAAASDGQSIVVTGADAGAILRDAGLFRNALGGDLRLTMVQTGGPGVYRGAFVIHNLRVKDAPVLAALLSAASIIGFLEQLDGKGLAFITVSGAFTMADGVITLSRAKAVGASIGLSLEGRFRPADGQFDMNGVISPLYAINGIFEKIPLIGRLLGGKDGEGLIGFNYTLRGSASAPKISVNPLSILTPGALREILAPRREPVPGQ